ncbi:MAG: hypothetical protein B6U94_07260 [Thermofilum sp. ex4484_79]|nr:MAG: hypothetical protein B6U94_07260 [Thermofilum sp. ex4484_79]
MRKMSISIRSLFLIILLLGFTIALLPANRSAFLVAESSSEYDFKVIGVILYSYARVYTLKEAYWNADLVILGEIIWSENYVWKASSESLGDPYLVQQEGGWMKVELSGKYLEGWVIVPEDPPMRVGERVILFLKGPISEGDHLKYPNLQYRYMGVFGRFKVVDGKVYSAMYFLPIKIDRFPSRMRAVLTLKGLEGYEEVNGITIEEFLNLVKN